MFVHGRARRFCGRVEADAALVQGLAVPPGHPDFMAQGGDVEKHNGAGKGISIYGRTFADEEASLAFDSPGVVAMAATKGQDANGCQFFVSLGEAPWLDGKHVAFGRVSTGLDVLRAIEERGSAHGRTRGVVVVANCGQLQ